jgi:cyclic-di-AMP phosphodiesterase PgpH
MNKRTETPMLINWRSRKRTLKPGVEPTSDVLELWRNIRTQGVWISLMIAGFFVIGATAILLKRGEVVQVRPGQYVGHDITARTEFRFHDRAQFEQAQAAARVAEPRIFSTDGKEWEQISNTLRTWPDRVRGISHSQLEQFQQQFLDQATLGKLQEFAEESMKREWTRSVEQFIESVQSQGLVIVSDGDRQAAIGRMVRVGANVIQGSSLFSPGMKETLARRLEKPAQDFFPGALAPRVVQLTLLTLEATHRLDPLATQQAENAAAERVPFEAGNVQYSANQSIVPSGVVSQRHYDILRAEADAFSRKRGMGVWWQQALGTLALVSLLTVALGAYVARYQHKIIRNHGRGTMLALMLLAVLLVSQLAALASTPIYMMGVIPTLLAAAILAIGYDQRFALGTSTILAVLVTLGLNESMGFFLVLFAGVATCTFTMGDLRSRSRLIEVGGLTGIACGLTTLFVSMLNADPLAFALLAAAWATGAGLLTGFIVLGILPRIEQTFRITTGMSLLELADTSHPLLRKLASDAPGTYSHSMQVASLSEEAAAAIGANALLCRVGAYYHDCGKINKPGYFVENNVSGADRHINLSPSVSFLIIMAHVKDGVELAREYNLPTNLFPFIQQHHGTTLVEYFYHRAQKQQAARDEDMAEVGLDSTDEAPEHQYRYPGPKPRSKEVAIVMLADAIESKTRAISAQNQDLSAGGIEQIVHELVLKRLLDGQFDECDITMRELEMVERSMVKTLLGIYHARVAYPGNDDAEHDESLDDDDVDAESTPSVRSA